MKLDPRITPLTNIKSIWTRYHKTPRRKHVEKVPWCWSWHWFFGYGTKTSNNKLKINKQNYIKLKSFFTAKEKPSTRLHFDSPEQSALLTAGLSWLESQFRNCLPLKRGAVSVSTLTPTPAEQPTPHNWSSGGVGVRQKVLCKDFQHLHQGETPVSGANSETITCK